jgi:hypothetical protein
MHTAVDLVNETKLDDEIKSWLAFAAQKVVEVNALAKALAGQKDEVRHCSFPFILLRPFNFSEVLPVCIFFFFCIDMFVYRLTLQPMLLLWPQGSHHLE